MNKTEQALETLMAAVNAIRSDTGEADLHHAMLCAAEALSQSEAPAEQPATNADFAPVRLIAEQPEDDKDEIGRFETWAREQGHDIRTDWARNRNSMGFDMWLGWQAAKRDALTQAPQEPFAYFQRNPGWNTWEEVLSSAAGDPGVVAAYRTPVQAPQERAAVTLPAEWLKPGAVVPVTHETVRMLLDALLSLAQSSEGEKP